MPGLWTKTGVDKGRCVGCNSSPQLAALLGEWDTLESDIMSQIS